MRRRFVLLVPLVVLVFAVACSSSCTGGMTGAPSIDGACKSLDPQRVNDAFKVSDIKFVVDEPVKQPAGEPGRDCAFLDRASSDDGAIGMLFAVRLVPDNWQPPSTSAFKRVDIGDEGFEGAASLFHVRKGKWIIIAMVGGRLEQSMNDAAFQQAVRDVVKQFVAALPRD